MSCRCGWRNGFRCPAFEASRNSSPFDFGTGVRPGPACRYDRMRASKRLEAPEAARREGLLARRKEGTPRLTVLSHLGWRKPQEVRSPQGPSSFLNKTASGALRSIHESLSFRTWADQSLKIGRRSAAEACGCSTSGWSGHPERVRTVNLATPRHGYLGRTTGRATLRKTRVLSYPDSVINVIIDGMH